MPLPSSGPLTLAQIQTEFGGTNPISLNEYYAGGAFVPAGTTGTHGAVPSSGTISIRNFYGTSKDTITAAQVDVYAGSFVFGSDAIASVGYYASGQYETDANGSSTNQGNWVTPPSSAANWQMRAILTSGSSPSFGVLNTWLSMTADRTWGNIQPASGVGFRQSVLTFEFRRVGGTAAEFAVTGNVLTAEVLF